MDTYEILVHIAAPSGVRDDNRYLAQAAAVARFEPATVTAVYGANSQVDMPGRKLDTPSTDASFATSLDGWSSIVKETPAQSRSRHLNHLLSKVGGLPTSSAPVTASPARWRVTKDINTNKQEPRPIPNPPYKNPFRNRELRQPTIQALRTPDPPRPNTAPSGDTTRASDSLTGWVTCKRARSESSSFESVASIVPETQRRQYATTAVNSSDSDTQYISSTESPTTHFELPMRLSQESAFEDDTPLKRQRLPTSSSDEARPPKRQHVAEPENEKELPSAKGDATGTVIVEHRLGAVSPHRDNNEHSRPFFLRDRSLDWTSPSAASSPDPSGSTTTATATATATPSQPLPGIPRQSSPSNNPKSLSAYHNQTSPINLVSQDLQSTPQRRFPALNLPPAPRSSPPFPDPSPHSPISSLPKRVCPKPPATGHGAFVTHITPSLERLLERKISISKCFRPVYVSRDVNVLERGYWRLPIIIASAEAIAEARVREDKAIKMARIRDGLTVGESLAKVRSIRAEEARRRALGLSSSPIEYDEAGQTIERKRCDMWTEAEFLDFWNILAMGIGSGNCGWGVSVYREDLAEPPRPPSSSPTPTEVEETTAPRERKLLLKVYTWGEVIPHMWLWMWVISNKLTTYIPMEWWAGDGSVLVRMSGYRRRHGVLGDWVYKGPAGEKGTWGIRH